MQVEEDNPIMEQRNGQGSDHDRLIRMEEVIDNLRGIIRGLQKDNQKLMNDRAKLIGWCAGVSGAVGFVLRYFLPAK